MMRICKQCGVELDKSMEECPLCENSTSDFNNHKNDGKGRNTLHYKRRMSGYQRKFVWEIVSIILFTGIISTFVIDFIINKTITWSEYPIAINLIVFSYISLFAFWRPRFSHQFAGSFIMSSGLLILFDFINGGISWSIKLGMPVLLCANIVLVTLIVIFRKSKHKGINLIAYSFIALAFQCICIESAVSKFLFYTIELSWSIIVAACIFPIAVVLLLFHYRYKRGRNLKKVFHI